MCGVRCENLTEHHFAVRRVEGPEHARAGAEVGGSAGDGVAQCGPQRIECSGRGQEAKRECDAQEGAQCDREGIVAEVALIQRREGVRGAGGITLGDVRPREVFPRGREVGTEARGHLERGNRFGSSVAQQRSAMEQLVAQLHVAEEEVAPALRLGSQRIETRCQRQLLGTNQAGVPGGKRIDVAEIPRHPRGIVLDAEPAFDFTQPPGAEPARGVGGFRHGVRAIGVLPLSRGDEMLGLEKAGQTEGAVGQRAARQGSGEGTLLVPNREQDAIGQRVAQRRPRGEWGRHFGQRRSGSAGARVR